MKDHEKMQELYQAHEVCVVLEKVIAHCHAHIAIGGGTATKLGRRKDIDLIVYPADFRGGTLQDMHLNVLDAREALLQYFKTMGVPVQEQFTERVIKLSAGGKDFDILFCTSECPYSTSDE